MGELKKKTSKKRSVVSVSSRQANLKRKLRSHLASLGFKSKDGRLHASGDGKEIIRALHAAQRNERLHQNLTFIETAWPELSRHFASGSDIDPSRIDPKLELVKSGTWQSDLFRLASLTWAVPVSNGFGRRLRYLVWDNQNSKLIGLLAIGDPVFNLTARDQLIKWNAKQRGSRLVNVMDAYVLGALPPYNMLLGGKLVASLVRTRDLYDDFLRAYGNTRGIISKRKKNARLLIVTTSSSLGRSSIYNRLKLDKVQYFKPIGFTRGWGHFHIPDELFEDLRKFLREKGHRYADRHRFGQGPNWRLRTTRAALGELGLKDEILWHGVQREVFMCEMATNSLKILRKGSGRPYLRGLLCAKEVGALAVTRWMIPRAERMPEYKAWKADNLRSLLTEQNRESVNRNSQVIKMSARRS